jgi:hypothetical protein
MTLDNDVYINFGNINHFTAATGERKNVIMIVPERQFGS